MQKEEDVGEKLDEEFKYKRTELASRERKQREMMVRKALLSKLDNLETIPMGNARAVADCEYNQSGAKLLG